MTPPLSGRVLPLLQNLLTMPQSPEVRASQLLELAQALSAQYPDLEHRIRKIAPDIASGVITTREWKHSPLHQRLSRAHEALRSGVSIDDAFQDDLSPPQQLQKVIDGFEPKPFNQYPEPDWTGFHAPLVPPRPDPRIHAPHQKIEYILRFIAMMSTGDDQENGFEEFWSLSSTHRANLHEGTFATSSLGDYPTSVVESILQKAATLSPGGAQLLGIFFVYDHFEKRRWPFHQRANDEEHTLSWHHDFLFQLRQNFATGYLSVEKRGGIDQDTLLADIVSGRVSLETVTRFRGKIRRDLFTGWLQRFHETKISTSQSQDDARRLGHKIRKEAQFAPPAEDDSREVKWRWLIRYWMTVEHLGIIPQIRGPVAPEILQKIACRRPGSVPITSALETALKSHFGGYYTPEELESLTLGPERLYVKS